MSVLLTLLFQAIPASATAQTEEWARALVATPHYASDDADARIAEWTALLAREPAHPLAEVTLALIESTAPDEPVESAQRVLTLDGSKMAPIAAARLASMQAERRLSLAPLEQLERGQVADLYPDRLARAWVLGPLRGAPWQPEGAALFADPGFGREHASLWGRKVSWSTLERGPTRSSFDPEGALAKQDGWALCSFELELPGGGPGWLELDFSDARGPYWVSLLAPRESGFRGSIEPPNFWLALNGQAPREIDFLSAERSVVLREPVLWLAGHNRVLLALTLGSGMDLAVRALDSDGRPWPQAAVAQPTQPLGAKLKLDEAPNTLVTSESWLELLEPRGPHAEALLGLIKLRDGRYTEGLSHVESALAMAPQSVELRALAADAYSNQSSFPETWRRGRARELLESVLREQPDHVRAQVAMARILAPEDKEEEAIAALESLRVATDSASPSLELAQLYERLDLEVRAEQRLRDALERAPRSRRALGSWAQQREQRGQLLEVLDARRAAAAGSSSLETLDALAQIETDLGHAAEALALRRAIATLSGQPGARAAVAEELVAQQQLDEADRLWGELEQALPLEPYFPMRRADVARRRGDAQAELAALERALERDPSNREARARLAAVGGVDPALATFARWAIDPERELQGFDAARWSDHVVRALDVAVVHVFEDGAFEQWLHERDVARDLEGCEALGKQRPQGEMISIATLKRSDGKSYEPVLVDQEYVMPALEPGDAVELVSRSFSDAAQDGRARTPQWFFASVEKPFYLSRYVISLPKSLNLELIERRFTGEHEVHDEGGRVVHVFTARGVDRVVPEPLSPPNDWYLPWIAFRSPLQREALARELMQEVLVPTRLAPQLIEAATAAAEGTESEEARARALHAFVTEALDRRSALARSSALSALLTHEGNATFLYAALLQAVGIDHELYWSRGLDPAADPDPEALLSGAERWTNQLLVLVRPSGAEPAWCDLSRKTLPYGRILAIAPNAEAFGTRSREWIRLPDVAPAERAGERTSLTVRLSKERSAELEVEVELTGNTGYVVKEQLREVPKTQMKRTVTGLVTRIVPGVDVGEYELRGLDSVDEPVVFFAKGRHKTLLDESSGEFVCKLPFPALELSRLASGEGQRRQPLFLQRSNANHVRARFELPEGRALIGDWPEVRVEFRGGWFRLAVEDAGPTGFTLLRELVLPAQIVPPEEFAAFVEFARRVDEAERARLRFR